METLNQSLAGNSNSFSMGVIAGGSSTPGSVDESGKPKRVFESMTIHKQYVEYHELKDSMYA